MTNSFPDNASLSSSIQYDEEKKIILYKVAKTPNKQTADHDYDLMVDLTKQARNFYILCDLTETKKPTAEIRQYFVRKYSGIQHRFLHVAIISGKNILMKMVALFGVNHLNLSSSSYHKTLIEAEKTIEKYIAADISSSGSG